MNYTSPPKNEANLIRELRTGSSKAFDTIYHLYFKRLFAYCLKFVKSEEEAEEIVHDVFLRLWKMREEIKQEESLKSLLFIISKSYVINSFQRTIKSQSFEDYLDYKDRICADDESDYELEYNDYLHLVMSKLERLPETQKRVIELTKLQELSIKETAEALSLSEQTVRNQLSLGLKSLRLMLRNETLLFIIFVKILFF